MKNCVHGGTQNKSAAGGKQRRQLEANFFSERSLRLNPDVAQLQKICPTVLSSGRRTFIKNELFPLCIELHLLNTALSLRSNYREIPLDPSLKKKCFLEAD